jgi:hypothetical protein
MIIVYGIHTKKLASLLLGYEVYTTWAPIRVRLTKEEREELDEYKTLAGMRLGGFDEDEPYGELVISLMSFIIHRSDRKKALWLPETVGPFVTSMLALMCTHREYGVEFIYTNSPQWLDALGDVYLPTELALRSIDSFASIDKKGNTPLEKGSFYGSYIVHREEHVIAPLKVEEVECWLKDGWQLGDLVNVWSPSVINYGPYGKGELL